MRRPSFDATDGALVSGDLTDLALGIALTVVFVLVVVLSFVFVFPLLLLIAEFVLAGFLLVGRFLLGRWTVVAQTEGERRTWRVRGRRESERFATQVVDALRSGSVLPPEGA